MEVSGYWGQHGRRPGGVPSQSLKCQWQWQEDDLSIVSGHRVSRPDFLALLELLQATQYSSISGLAP